MKLLCYQHNRSMCLLKNLIIKFPFILSNRTQTSVPQWFHNSITKLNLLSFKTQVMSHRKPYVEKTNTPLVWYKMMTKLVQESCFASINSYDKISYNLAIYWCSNTTSVRNVTSGYSHWHTSKQNLKQNVIRKLPKTSPLVLFSWVAPSIYLRRFKST